MSSHSAKMLKSALGLPSMTDALGVLQQAIALGDGERFSPDIEKAFVDNLPRFVVMSAGLVEQTLASNDNLARELQASKEETVAARQALMEAWMQVAEEQIYIDDAKNLQTANHLAQCFARSLAGHIDQALCAAECLLAVCSGLPQDDPANRACAIILSALSMIKQNSAGFSQNMQDADIGAKKVFNALRLFDSAKYFLSENDQLACALELEVDNRLPASEFYAHPAPLLATVQEGLQNILLHCPERKAKASIAYEGEQIVVCVSDYGPPLPKDQSDKIFAPFYTSMPGVRPGIGLTRIKKLLQQAGGDAKFICGPGQLNTLYASMPAEIRYP